MPAWSRIVLRAVGLINATVVLVGAAFLIEPIYQVLTRRLTGSPKTPYFLAAFTLMATVEVIFLCFLFATAARFIQGRLSAVNFYTLTVLLLIVYFVAILRFWRGDAGPVNLSVAAATGITGAATMLFEFLFVIPFLYPLASVIFVQVLRYRYASDADN